MDSSKHPIHQTVRHQQSVPKAPPDPVQDRPIQKILPAHSYDHYNNSMEKKKAKNKIPMIYCNI